jgi:O-antigen/teichoic acid export membrane protein
VGSLRHIAKHSSIYAVADILAKLVGFILLPLYTRRFSTVEYGILALILAANTIPSRLVSQGINTWTLRAITVDYADDPRKRKVALSTAFHYLNLSAVVVNGLLILIVQWLGPLLLRTDEYNRVLAWALFASILETVKTIPYNVLLRAQFRSVLYSIIGFSRFLVSVGLNLYFILGLGWGIEAIVYADVIVAALTAVVGVIILAPELVPAFSWSEVNRMIRYGWPLVPARIFMWLLDFADRFQLNYLSTTVEVGLYAAGVKYARIFQFLFLAQFEKVWPSVYFPLSREKNAGQQFGKLFTYLFLAACSLGVTVVLAVDPLARLTLESSYWRASHVVVWLVSGFILEVTYQVVTAGLRITGQTGYLPLIVGVATAVNVLTNFIILPHWGMMGAGFTTFLANGVLVVLGFRFSNRVFPIPFEWGRLARIAGMYSSVLVVDWIWCPAELRAAIGFKALALLAYAVGLVALGVFTREDVQGIKGLMRDVRQRAAKLKSGRSKAVKPGEAAQRRPGETDE